MMHYVSDKTVTSNAKLYVPQLTSVDRYANYAEYVPARKTMDICETLRSSGRGPFGSL